MADRIPHGHDEVEIRQAFQRLERKSRNIDISDDTNLAVTSPVVLTDDTLSLDQAAIDHGMVGGLGDDDHTIYLLADGSRNLTGNLALSAGVTIDGRDISVDGTKLDGIEALADVTDATNVAAAGAAMSGGAFHDGFSDFVGNEHIDHSGVSISSGTGLSGGGTIASTRTLALSHLGIELLSDPGADRILFWDDGETACKWLQVDGVGKGLSGTTLTVNASYVDRGSLTAPDFGADPEAGSDPFAGNYDNAYHDLDLSSIIPSGTYAVAIGGTIITTNAGDRTNFKNADHAGDFNYSYNPMPVANSYYGINAIITVSSARKIKWKANANVTINQFMIRGWYI